MTKKIAELHSRSEQLKLIYTPRFLRLNNPADKIAFDNLLEDNEVTFIHDEIYSQLQELVKSLNPSIRIKPAEYEGFINSHTKEKDLKEYGVWVYYPWSQRMVHLLDEEEFIEVRTNRNQYKITRFEKAVLSTKKIGIVGLSVGQSIALTLAMERGFGELRLADFDILELSNLNRIRTSAHNMGVPKVVIAAREIAEIDPFLKVTCFFDGLTENNMDSFFTENGKLDILVDECDGLDMKIFSRYKARELGIPVLMDTSDRGMLDVERFDLEPNRPILHGAVENVDPSVIKSLTNEEKIPIILQMLGADNISLRGKASMIEVEQTINTWPQLASSVALGGAVGADVCRRILLDQYHESGRYYVDLDDLVGDKKSKEKEPAIQQNPFSPLSANDMRSLAQKSKSFSNNDTIIPDRQTILELVKAACAAPSTGNDQPWKWFYHNGTLNLYHDQYRSYSFGDFQKGASFITFGATFENLYIHALKKNLELVYQFFPLEESETLVASIRFKNAANTADSNILALDDAIFNRHTNRNPGQKTTLDQLTLDQLKQIAESIPGAQLKWFTDENDLNALAKIIGACDRTRLLNPAGHHDFVHHEMRWTSEDAEQKKDGIDIKTLGMSNSQLAALSIIKNEDVIRTINELEGGYAFDNLAKKMVDTASALCMITFPKYKLESFFEGGRSMERFWLAATNLNLAIHPLISPFYLFARVLHGNGEGLSERNIRELTDLRNQFVSITKLEDNRAEVFLTKVSMAEEPAVKSFRLPLEEILVIE